MSEIRKIKVPIDTRMKRYELSSKSYLIPHIPAIIRIDGKAFHTFTKKIYCKTPFDEDLKETMVMTMKELVDAIQGAVFAYRQSDEISILLYSGDDLNTEQWFGGNIQKIVSVSCSIATHFFNKYKEDNFMHLTRNTPAFFDSRVFNIPKEEVTNYFIWRQQDATQNSIQMLGRSVFSHKETENLSANKLQDKLMLEKNINWNNIETWKKRGTSYHSNKIDDEIPIFTKDRDYIERFL